MKSIFLIVTGLLSANLSIAQSNVFPANGNVGIGTANPTENLEIVGNVKWNGNDFGNARALKFGYSGGSYGSIGYNIDFTSITSTYNRSINDQSSLLEFHHGGFRFYGTSNAEASNGVNLSGSGNNLNFLAAITNDGNMGIGISSPSAKLHVQGVVRAIHSVANDNSGDFENNSPTGYGLYSMGGGAGLGLYTFRFDNYLGSTVMMANGHGNVGIGTQTPQEKLSVNGKIRAKEVKVEASNWPDYVFKPNYKLLSLMEIEKHIKEKGHLPDLPTADEVEKNGVELGEMNKLLLKKIEELTLIVIDQQKIIKNQNNRLLKLEQKVKK